MAWDSLASNQMVSFTDAQTSPFQLRPSQSAVTSNQCMDKDAALTKYALDASAMSSYASNQLVPKSTWVNGLTDSCINVDINGSFPDGQNYINFSLQFVNAPLITTSFIITITGTTSGFSTNRSISTTELTLGGTFFLGNTDPLSGSGYTQPEASYNVAIGAFNDGTYYHQLCNVDVLFL